MAINVAVVEDDPIVLKYLSRLIDESPLCYLVGTASNKEQADFLIKANNADIYLVDLGLPDINGIDVIRRIKSECVSASAMVLTSLGDMRHVMESIRAGAAGYLLKDDDSSELISKLVSLHNGNSPVSARVAKILIEKIAESDKVEPSKPNAEAIEYFKLTSRELEILKELNTSKSVKNIANDLFVSYFTVTQHIRSIYRKLDVVSRAGALSKARTHELL